MQSNSLNKILMIILVILCGLSLYMMFSGNKNISLARREINGIKTDLNAAKDRIKNSQEILDSVFLKLNKTKERLEVIEDERNALVRNITQMLSSDKNHIQIFKNQYENIQAGQDSLLSEILKLQNERNNHD